jgi:hypothetical protein
MSASVLRYQPREDGNGKLRERKSSLREEQEADPYVTLRA